MTHVGDFLILWTETDSQWWNRVPGFGTAAWHAQSNVAYVGDVKLTCILACLTFANGLWYEDAVHVRNIAAMACEKVDYDGFQSTMAMVDVTPPLSHSGQVKHENYFLIKTYGLRFPRVSKPWGQPSWSSLPFSSAVLQLATLLLDKNSDRHQFSCFLSERFCRKTTQKMQPPSLVLALALALVAGTCAWSPSTLVRDLDALQSFLVCDPKSYLRDSKRGIIVTIFSSRGLICSMTMALYMKYHNFTVIPWYWHYVICLEFSFQH
jgi:hypothetical protein